MMKIRAKPNLNMIRLKASSMPLVIQLRQEEMMTPKEEVRDKTSERETLKHLASLALITSNIKDKEEAEAVEAVEAIEEEEVATVEVPEVVSTTTLKVVTSNKEISSKEISSKETSNKEIIISLKV